jgi:hypothetical protein
MEKYKFLTLRGLEIRRLSHPTSSQPSALPQHFLKLVRKHKAKSEKN